jgi:hypothetical protein
MGSQSGNLYDEQLHEMALFLIKTFVQITTRSTSLPGRLFAAIL